MTAQDPDRTAQGGFRASIDDVLLRQAGFTATERARLHSLIEYASRVCRAFAKHHGDPAVIDPQARP